MNQIKQTKTRYFRTQMKPLFRPNPTHEPPVHSSWFGQTDCSRQTVLKTSFDPASQNEAQRGKDNCQSHTASPCSPRTEVKSPYSCLCPLMQVVYKELHLNDILKSNLALNHRFLRKNSRGEKLTSWEKRANSSRFSIYKKYIKNHDLNKWF